MGSGTAAARTFDLKVVSKTGPEVTFTSINKEEHDPIENYLTSKKVRTKNEMVDRDLLGTAAADDSDDDEMQSVASDGSERPKPRAMDDDDESEEGMWAPEQCSEIAFYKIISAFIIQMRTLKHQHQMEGLLLKATPKFPIGCPSLAEILPSPKGLRKRKAKRPRMARARHPRSPSLRRKTRRKPRMGPLRRNRKRALTSV
jgi:hypothetical protein